MNHEPQYAERDMPMISMPSRSRSSFSRTTLWHMDAAATTNANTNASPKKTAAYVDPRFVEYAGKG